MNHIIPLNGKYLTSEDILSWTDCMDGLYSDCKDPTINITFIVTEDCNLNCSYCYEQHKTKSAMKKSTAKEAVDFLFNESKISAYYDVKNSKGIILEFIGGEPFLEIELIDYITEYFKYKANKENHIWKDNYMLSFSTNGTLMNDPKVKSYLIRNRNRTSVSVTVDGNKELHDTCRKFPNGNGSYDLASAALKQTVLLNQYSSTKLTICPENIEYLFPAVKNIYKEIGCHFVNANCVFEEGWTLVHANTFYNELIKLADYIIDNSIYNSFYCSLFDETIGKPENDLDRNWCGGTGKMLAIGTDGTCYPCLRYSPISLGDRREAFILGNIYDGLLQTDNICKNCAKLKSVTLFTQSPSMCLSCDVASGCSLCSAYNYEKFGDSNIRATYICEMHKARVRANEYYWDKLNRRIT